MEDGRIVSDIKRDGLNLALSSLRLEQLTTKILNQNSNSHKGVGLWDKSINHFGNFGRHFACATSAKILAAMYARVPQAMAQFVLKIEKLSHIMGPTPIPEMARAYGLHPRLWLLAKHKRKSKEEIIKAGSLGKYFIVAFNL